ncbi:MAG: hypothetical protein ACLTV6_11330 [Christensenellales bacterium]
MKHKTLVCLALAMMLIAACASAQQLPGVNCFFARPFEGERT